MKTQQILLVVGLIVLALLLVSRLQRPPGPQDVAQTSRSVAPANPPESSPLRQTDPEGETPVADAAAGPSTGDAVPAKPTILVRTDVRRQSSREVSIGLVLAGSDGRSLPVTSVVRTQQPPGLRIVNEAGQVVAQGSFQYG